MVSFIPANQKIMRVGAENGNANLAGMQPTTRAIYDTVDLSTFSAASNNTVKFFQNVNTKTYPFANIQRNVLTAGQALSVQQIYFLIFRKAAGVSPITKVETMDEAIGFSPLIKGDMSIIVANTQVLERYPISGSVGPFNPMATFSNPATSLAAAAAPGTGFANFRSSAVKTFPAQPVIIPEVEFTFDVTFPPVAPAAAADTVYLQLVVEGFATLYAPNGTI
jgi:hypothetical protein